MEFGKILEAAGAGVTAWAGEFWQGFSLNLALQFLVVYLFVVWGSLVVWVARDVTNRSSNILFQSLCVLLVLALSPLGIFIYLLIRPQRTVFEKYYENELGVPREPGDACPECGAGVREEWLFCPACDFKLREKCSGCKAMVETAWDFCPACGKKQEREEPKEEAKEKEKKK